MSAIDARAALINGNFTLPTSTPAAMKSVREILSKAALELKKVLMDEEHNVGCVIVAMDLLQQAKNKACDSLILPHYNEEEEEVNEDKND